jgi:hypothetical protein
MGEYMSQKEKDALEKIKKLEELIAKKKALLIREKGKLTEKERKARNKKLIALGSLIEAAGLMEADESFILGLLLSGSHLTPDSNRYAEFKDKGALVLKQQKKEKQ